MKNAHIPKAATLSVSIGIPAYNEEKNIKNLLKSILSQKEKNYTLSEIVIISDGSTDKTIEEAKKIIDKRIKIENFSKRLGKSSHLNYLFRNTKADILVLLDADTILASVNTVSSLVQPFLLFNNIGLIGGNPHPKKGITFIEKSVNASFEVYDILRRLVNNGNNAYGCDGRILALSKEFRKSVHVPYTMIANDAFLYFSCITKEFTFYHEKSAKVWYRSPSTLADQIRQNKRFIASRYRLLRIFGKIVSKEYKVSRITLCKLMFLQFLKGPLQCLTIFVINTYCRLTAVGDERNMDAKWPIAVSTKQMISYE